MGRAHMRFPFLLVLNFPYYESLRITEITKKFAGECNLSRFSVYYTFFAVTY